MQRNVTTFSTESSRAWLFSATLQKPYLILVLRPNVCYHAPIMEEEKINVPLHQTFAATLEKLLEPRDIEVLSEVEINKIPLKADVILVRRNGHVWTSEQLEVVPDGLQESTATYIFIEFKNSESFGRKATRAIITYEHSFQEYRSLSDEEIQGCIVVARTPQYENRKRFGYTIEVYPGVYHSTCGVLEGIPLIVLSELRTTPNNMFFKVFARNRRAKWDAVQRIYANDHTLLSSGLRAIMGEVLHLWYHAEEDDPMSVMADSVMERGRKFENWLKHELPDAVFLDVIQDREFFQRLQEDLILKGKQEGKQEGKLEGTQEGIILGQQQSLRIILQNRFGDLHPILDVALKNATSDQLGMLLTVALQVNSMDEFIDHVTNL